MTTLLIAAFLAGTIAANGSGLLLMHHYNNKKVQKSETIKQALKGDQDERRTTS